MFVFYKYIRPEWYFFLETSKKAPVYFIDYDSISDGIKSGLVLDHHFDSLNAQKWDLAYELFNKGVDYSTTCGAQELDKSTDISLADNYKFVHKHFHWAWLYYIYFFRLVCLYNPIKETLALYRTFGKKYVYNTSFERTLIVYCPPVSEGQYSVSVIIPTLNRYSYLYEALKCLEVQTYPIQEVIVVDQSEEYDGAFYEKFNLPIRVIHQNNTGQWSARNKAIIETKGDLIALYEDDVLVDHLWLYHHVNCIVQYQADISSGRIFEKAIQLNQYVTEKGIWSHYFPGGNAVVRRNVFETIGLFDRQYDGLRWGDGDWGMRAYLAGYKNVLNEKAFCVDRKAETGGLRTVKSWSGYRTSGLGIPSPGVFYFLLKYYEMGNILPSVVLHLPGEILSGGKTKRNYLLGAIIIVLSFPYWLLVLVISFRRGRSLLKAGSKIDYL